jgi:hypothetical protein
MNTVSADTILLSFCGKFSTSCETHGLPFTILSTLEQDILTVIPGR